MTVTELAGQIGGRQCVPGADYGRVVQGGYASDLLSDVIANATEGDLWVTLQKHVNTVAVAHLKGLAGIVLVNGREPEAETIARAAAEGLPILSTELPAFEVVGILHAAGVSGRRLH